MSDDMKRAVELSNNAVARGYRGDVLTLARALLAAQAEVERMRPVLDSIRHDIDGVMRLVHGGKR